METKVLYNPNKHFEHKLWKVELSYWEDELESINYRLSELVTRWISKEVQAKLDHYQSEFAIHGGVIEDMLEAIEAHDMRIVEQSKKGDDSLDTQLTKKHIKFRNKMERQRDIYTQLKKDFFRFLGEYM